MGEGGQNEVSLEAAPKRGPPSPTPLLFVPQNHKTLVYHTPYCCGLTLSCHDWMIGAPTCGCSVIIYLRTGSSKKHSISPSGNTIRNNASMHTAERRNFWRWTYISTYTMAVRTRARHRSVNRVWRAICSSRDDDIFFRISWGRAISYHQQQ